MSEALEEARELLAVISDAMGNEISADDEAWWPAFEALEKLEAALSRSAPDREAQRCPHGVWKADHCYQCESPAESAPAPEGAAYHIMSDGTTISDADGIAIIECLDRGGKHIPAKEMALKIVKLLSGAKLPAPEGMGRDNLECGHPLSFLVKSVESDYQFCEYCECKKERNDALQMEEYYKAKLINISDNFKSRIEDFMNLFDSFLLDSSKENSTSGADDSAETFIVNLKGFMRGQENDSDVLKIVGRRIMEYRVELAHPTSESGRVEEQKVICAHDIPLNHPCAQCFRGDYQPFADWWQSLSQDQRAKLWPYIDSIRFAYQEGLIHGKASHSQPSVKEKL